MSILWWMNDSGQGSRLPDQMMSEQESRMIASTVYNGPLLYLKKPVRLQYVVAIDDSKWAARQKSSRTRKHQDDSARFEGNEGSRVPTEGFSVSAILSQRACLLQAGIFGVDLNTVNMTAIDARHRLRRPRRSRAVTLEPRLPARPQSAPQRGICWSNSSTTPAYHER